MAFTLRIANQPDRTTRQHGVPDHVDAPIPTVATILTAGHMQQSDVVRLAVECRQLFQDGADTVVMELNGVTFADAATRIDFVNAVLNERRSQCHLFARIEDRSLHESFRGAEDVQTWLLPFNGDETVPRRSVITHSPIDEATRPADA